MQANGLAPLVEAHEDRLQRVEFGISGLSIKVAEIGTKQDLYHQFSQEQNQHILDKIESLGKVEEGLARVKRKIDKEDAKGEWLREFLPFKLIRKYFIHAIILGAGAMSHKGWLALWDWIERKA
jgi:hypothetical protein